MPPWIGYCETTSPKTSADQQLAGADDDDPEDRGRAAGADGEREERVDADERREIGESEGEVRPERHRAVEGILVAEDRQMFAVAEVLRRCDVSLTSLPFGLQAECGHARRVGRAAALTCACRSNIRSAMRERESLRIPVLIFEQRRCRTQPMRIIFLLTNSSAPKRPSSRPEPERLTPPKGSSAPSAPTTLTKTMPASMRSATRRACSGSVVNT